MIVPWSDAPQIGFGQRQGATGSPTIFDGHRSTISGRGTLIDQAVRMGLRSFEDYVAGVRDGRDVWVDGERVADVTEHPWLSVGLAHTGTDFRLASDPAHRALAVATDPETGEPMSRYWALPRTADDLLQRRELIAEGTRAGRGVVPLVKEIGSDAVFGLRIVAELARSTDGGVLAEKAETLWRRARRDDLAFAVAQTDVKGDRSRRPSEQPHPDLYLRIVERRVDGIVVRGAKAHTTGTPFADELIVLPTRAMSAGDADYAVSFAIPVATPGLRMIAEASSRARPDDPDSPVSGRHKMVDTLTIFDDVFVPEDRVFLAGEHELAGPLAGAFVDFHRFTAAAYKLPMCQLFVGAASLLARANGTAGVAHVRDGLAALVAWTETTRALIVAAAHEHHVVPPGIAVPDPVLTNLAKQRFADDYHHMVKVVQDIAGGLVATVPSAANWETPELAADLDRYLQGAAGTSGRDRARLMSLVRDITASEFGGYQGVLSIHAEGSLAAQRLAVGRGYDIAACERFAAAVAGTGH